MRNHLVFLITRRKQFMKSADEKNNQLNEKTQTTSKKEEPHLKNVHKLTIREIILYLST